MTTPDARDYRNRKMFSESKIKLKAYQNPFVGFKWVRNQEPTIGDTFNKIKDRRGHTLTAWIQQRHFEPAPLMWHPETRLQIHNEDDSVLPDPPKIYGKTFNHYIFIIQTSKKGYVRHSLLMSGEVNNAVFILHALWIQL